MRMCAFAATRVITRPPPVEGRTAFAGRRAANDVLPDYFIFPFACVAIALQLVLYVRQSLRLVNVQALNTLDSRNSPHVEEDARVMLIDYELACYGYCAMDLGGHLSMRLLDTRNREFSLSGESFATDAEIRFFLRAYLEESWRLGSIARVKGESDDTALDHLQRETLIGSMIHSLFVIESVLVTEASVMMAAAPGMCTALALLLREYRRTKELLFPELA